MEAGGRALERALGETDPIAWWYTGWDQVQDEGELDREIVHLSRGGTAGPRLAALGARTGRTGKTARERPVAGDLLPLTQKNPPGISSWPPPMPWRETRSRTGISQSARRTTWVFGGRSRPGRGNGLSGTGVAERVRLFHYLFPAPQLWRPSDAVPARRGARDLYRRRNPALDAALWAWGSSRVARLGRRRGNV